MSRAADCTVISVTNDSSILIVVQKHTSPEILYGGGFNKVLNRS